MKLKMILLHALVASEHNVRKTHDIAQPFEELQASLLHHGVQTPLHVIANTDGTHEVVAGSRRLRALQSLDT